MEFLTAHAAALGEREGVTATAAADPAEEGFANASVTIRDDVAIDWEAFVAEWSRPEEIREISVRMRVRGAVADGRLQHVSRADFAPNAETREAMASAETDRFLFEGLLERRQEPDETGVVLVDMFTLRARSAHPIP